MSARKFEVGDKVIVTSVNRGRGYEGTVTKVGRTLVYVANRYSQVDAFRIDTGAKNDKYRHETVWTLDERAENERRILALTRLRGHHLCFDMGYGRNVATETIEALADLMDAATEVQP